MNKKEIKNKIQSLKDRRVKVLSTYDWREKDNTYEFKYIQDIDKEIRQLSIWLYRR